MLRQIRRGAGLVLLLAGIGLVGCDSGGSGSQVVFNEQAFEEPSDFTRTDASGRVLEDDASDWQVSPRYPGLRVQPAFPNPPGDRFVNIPVSILGGTEVPGGLTLCTDLEGVFRCDLDVLPDATQEGLWDFVFNPALLGGPGLHRVFILDGTGTIVSFGDVFVE